jgi:hypothetical protein
MKIIWIILVCLTDFAVFAQTDGPSVTMNLWSTNVDKRIRVLAQQLFQSGVVVATMDKIDHHITVSSKNPPLDIPFKLDVDLSIHKDIGEEPKLVLGASYLGPEWAFVDSVIFRIGTNIITIPSKPERTVLEGDPTSVSEVDAWTVEGGDLLNIVRGVAWGKEKIIVRFAGKKDDLTFDLSDKTRQDFKNIITVYFAMGGKPLSKSPDTKAAGN